MTSRVKFQLIYEATQVDDNLMSISTLCKIAQVSRSGYYNWLNTADKRQEREDKDKDDFDLILAAYQKRGYAKGARSIYMQLLHIDIVMNIKKIRRLMRKYGLKCPIRKANAYRRMAKALKTNTVFPNVVNREFVRKPRKILLTDITYLFYNGGVCYLSTILDSFTREVLAYELSENLKVEFVLSMVEKLTKEHGCTLDNETIVHSDQGCHYTSLAFIEKIRTEGFVQSMSRKGNCWDNAPQESFFGHMKDEIRYEVSKKSTFEEVKTLVDDWIDYYNTERYQWDLAKLSPNEYYQYATTGVYHLKIKQTSWDSAPNPEV